MCDTGCDTNRNTDIAENFNIHLTNIIKKKKW